MKILIVEDEYKLAELIENRLLKENYTVDISTDGEQGSIKALSNCYDLIILDVMLPKKDGFTILKEIKEFDIDSKVIMLTAKSEIENKIKGFEIGADDYLTKPFHLEELVVRIKRFTIDKDNNYLSYGDIKLDLKRKCIINITTSEEIEVLCKEFQLLEYLIRNNNQILSKELLYEKVWGIENESISNNLEAYISFIRKKLKTIESSVNIKALRGLGYKLEVLDE